MGSTGSVLAVQSSVVVVECKYMHVDFE
uniref:Uncharacterized protein n=1 Tax=Anguilla anguilla TaxID=7936 RepID=A0A0E9QCD6_ANGAN